MMYALFEPMWSAQPNNMYAPTVLMTVLTLWFLYTVYKFKQHNCSSAGLAMGIAGFYWSGVAITVGMIIA